MEKGVLVIDDNPNFIELMKYNLEKNAIPVKTRRSKYYDAREIDFSNFSVIVSDFILPKSDGIRLCEEIKSNSESKQPLFILLVPEQLKLNFKEALDSGIDDIFFKPVRIMSLVANIKNLLNLDEPTMLSTQETSLSLIENATIDNKSYKVVIEDEPVHFNLIEFNLFKLFLCNPGKILTYGQLYLELNAFGFILGLNSITFQVNLLSKKLQRFNFSFVNVQNVGFKLEIA
jgi:DNA-binding response OmpR family regulator